jgi:glycine cleavage system H lipoate-binding protein
MAKNQFKQHNMQTPIEKHDTAAWANIESTKSVSKVTLPSETQVSNAKEHVDSNQK